jgi:hypothetical protein
MLGCRGVAPVPGAATVDARSDSPTILATSPVDAATARRLFREPIDRDQGLGIGLYHAARQAQQAGYRVELTENAKGHVCFALTREAASGG